MGTGRRQGRPEVSAAAVADACAQLVESLRTGPEAFTAATRGWCDAVLADEGWALWLWRGGSGFELRAEGGRPPPPRPSIEAVAASLGSEATRRELATGRPVVLDAASSGPETSAAVVAFGSPSQLLAVLATFRRGARSALAGADLEALAAAARLCAAGLEASSHAGDDGSARPAGGRTRLQPALLAELRDSLAAIVGFAHTLIRSEHRLGRVDRRRYHEVIERQALSLADTVDDIALVAGVTHLTAPGSEAEPVHGETLAAELTDHLGPGVDYDVGPSLAGALLPRGVDPDALARALAGLVRVAASMGSQVGVAASSSATVWRVGVAAVVDTKSAEQLVELAEAVAAGDEDVVWSGRAPLAVAAASAAARAHGGVIGADADGDVVRIWLDLPAQGAAP